MGHPGTAKYREALAAVAKGGNLAMENEQQAIHLIKEAFPGIPDLTGKTEKRRTFGFEVETFIPKDAEGKIINGHMGKHINYYDSENGVRSTITIIEEL